jgi:hypothetical protein
MSVSTAQALEHLVKNMNSSYLGEVAGEDFLGGLNTMLANVDPKDQEEILQKIVNIDWSQWDAGREVVDIIKAMGYELEVSEEVIDAWIL